MEKAPKLHQKTEANRSISLEEIEAIMRAAREKFNKGVKVRAVPKYTRDARVSTVWGPNSQLDKEKRK